ncbi:MAG: DUF523 domain-containing protein [Chloroflexia bacterium]|nr:DUF523 domain-containing protein [Chloroflexia bacterium]
MYLISACLVGQNCRYNGSNSRIEKLVSLVSQGKAIAVCPELLGGLTVPREPCELITLKGEAKILTKLGADHTMAFVNGARKTLEICLNQNIKKAILQPRSPSCGFGLIYDGTFTGKLTPGNGITSELLAKNDIEVIGPDDWDYLSEKGLGYNSKDIKDAILKAKTKKII